MTVILDKHFLPEDSIMVGLQLVEGGNLQLVTGENFNQDIHPTHAHILASAALGISWLLHNGLDTLIRLGDLHGQQQALLNQPTDFEFDDVIVPFTKPTKPH